MRIWDIFLLYQLLSYIKHFKVEKNQISKTQINFTNFDL